MSPQRTETIPQSQLGRWYNVFFDNIAADGIEKVTIALEQDLGIEEDEAVLIWGARLSWGSNVADEGFADDELNHLGARFRPHNDSTEDEDIMPQLMLAAHQNTTADVYMFIPSDQYQCQPPVLQYSNFVISARNLDPTNTHDALVGILFSVVKISQLTALDIFELARRAPGEVS